MECCSESKAKARKARLAIIILWRKCSRNWEIIISTLSWQARRNCTKTRYINCIKKQTKGAGQNYFTDYFCKRVSPPPSLQTVHKDYHGINSPKRAKKISDQKRAKRRSECAHQGPKEPKNGPHRAKNGPKGAENVDYLQKHDFRFVQKQFLGVPLPPFADQICKEVFDSLPKYYNEWFEIDR